MKHSPTTAGATSASRVSAADRSVLEAVNAGLIMQTIDDVEYSGRYAQIAGQKLLNFGSCSYLALEQRPELKRAAIDAIERFGTQFSFSRAYLQLPLYDKLEDALSAVTEGYVLVAPSTTLGHIAALPVIVEAGDAVIIDQFAHASLHMATLLLRSIPVHPVRHNRVDLLEEKIAALAPIHRRIWCVIDGLYSMKGDFAPLDSIASLLAKYPQLHLYVDDAHSTSWTGKNGRGYALDQLDDRSRVVVALGLAKAFGVGGAALVFPTDAERQRVRRCGGPMLFSGPLQPPLLGAALASATLHLRPEFLALQQALSTRIENARALARGLDLSFAAKDHTPIFFVRCGPSSATFALARALRDEGIYVCISVFPAVPQNQSGIRFTISLHNTPADIERLVFALSAQMQRLGISAIARRRSKSTPPGCRVTNTVRPSTPTPSAQSSSPPAPE